MKKFTEVEIKIVRFETEDVMTGSPEFDNEENGGGWA